MESSKLIIEKREKIYYGKYLYRANFICRGISRTRYAKNMERILHYSKYYREELKPIEIKIIENYLKWIETNKKEVSVRIENSKIGIYSNNLDLLKTLENFVQYVTYTKAESVITTDGIKYFVRSPKHSYRVYLKNKGLSGTEISDFKELLQRYEDQLYPSKSLKFWLDRTTKYSNMNFKVTYMYGSNYIEYDNPSLLSILYLSCSTIISKSYKLEKQPDK